jgi:hypothetical protein
MREGDEGETFKVGGTEGRLSEKRRKMEEEYVYNTVRWNYYTRCAR